MVPLGLTASYVVFTVAVHLRLLDHLDVALRHVARPGDVWGPAQIRAARLVNALQPSHLALLLGLVVTALSLRRRSLRPLVVMAVIGLPVVIVTLGTKWAMAHLDPRTVPVGHGSYPSGHAVFTVTAFGVAVLLLVPGSWWGWLLPAAMGCVMGVALVLAQVHPVTDVIGAGLLAAAALTGAAAARLGQWAFSSQRRRAT
jgi:membrane-associated phospholipid phosphatase